MMRQLCAALALLLSAIAPVRAIDPDDPGPADVQFTINAGQSVKPISRYIYGANFYDSSGIGAPVTLDREGGNRWTGYNWETNASNAGSDWRHQSDNYLVNGQSNTPPGEAVRPEIVSAGQNNRALIVTVPMAGYVAADASGQTVTMGQTAPSSRWHEVQARKSSVYPGSPVNLTPDESDGYVFTDEYVNWVEHTRDQQSNPPAVFYSLDNEPALWSETHARLHPAKATFAEMKSKTIAHASAIKDVAPEALVFGGVPYGYGEFTALQDAPDSVTSPSHPGGDQTGEHHYLEWLLNEVRIEEQAQGRKLMDVLDVHWYPEARGADDEGKPRRIVFDENPLDPGVVAARLQAPRSLWDPSYGYNPSNPVLGENSWIAQWGTQGPIELLARLQRDIDDFNPGTKLAISEYSYGGSNHISGGIAQADALGIFGREGLFAATYWHLEGGTDPVFVNGAFNMYLNFDGQGSQFGDTSVGAATSNIASSAVYASVDSNDPTKIILVAINRTATPLDTGLAVTSDLRFDRAEVFQLTSANASPIQASDISIEQVNAFHYTMPAYSVSTLVLHAVAGLAGDFDEDGDVDGHDFLVWQRNPSIGDLADWQGNYGVSSLTAAVSVPEPTPIALSVIALLILAKPRDGTPWVSHR